MFPELERSLPSVLTVEGMKCKALLYSVEVLSWHVFGHWVPKNITNMIGPWVFEWFLSYPLKLMRDMVLLYNLEQPGTH